MPIYEYECLSCGQHFEELKRFSDPAMENCAECKGPVRRLLFPAAVIFKGSGFYATEYGKSKANSGKAAAESAAGPAASKDEKKGSDSSASTSGDSSNSSSSSSSSNSSNSSSSSTSSSTAAAAAKEK